jgi:hypothetical protein
MNAELEQIRSSVVRVTHHIDRKDWGAPRALFADEVETDYMSLLHAASRPAHTASASMLPIELNQHVPAED